jgi:hypothetical protein
MFFPRSPYSRIWPMLSSPLDGQRILGADIDNALARADGVACDEHALQHRVRVGLDERPCS